MPNSLDNTTEYSFVLLTLFFKTGRNNESCCDVILLVDKYNWIHDYKIKWRQLSLTEFTTASHFNKINNSFRFKFREKILRASGLENIPNPNSRIKKTYVNLSLDQIQKVNSLFDREWRSQSFSNIDYVITGSNAAGQGIHNKSSFYLKQDNSQKFNIGFLFQSLRLTFNKNELQSNEFEQIWKNYMNNSWTFTQYKFDEWLNNNHELKKDFLFFNRDLKEEEHKKKIKEIKNRYCPQKEKYEVVYNTIWKYRQNLLNDINKNKKKFVIDFWNKQFTDNFIKLIEFAHIKPVSKIKDECISQKFNKDILRQIKDKNNILPLNPDTHTLFDKKEICWNSSGDLFFIHDNTNNVEILDDLKKIPSETLFKIKKYLDWYLINICHKS